MGVCTAFAVAAFGMLLASVCRTRAQLGALSTLVILIMSSVGGSMFPRFLMPEAMQKAGLLTINAWAIDGFTKVFWRDEPVSHLWPQVSVLLAIAHGAVRDRPKNRAPLGIHLRTKSSRTGVEVAAGAADDGAPEHPRSSIDPPGRSGAGANRCAHPSMADRGSRKPPLTDGRLGDADGPGSAALNGSFQAENRSLIGEVPGHR